MEEIKFVDFLSNLKLNYKFKRNKTVEVDLKGDLNPNQWLDYYFFNKKSWLDFEDFYKEYISELHTNLQEHYKEHYTHIEWNDFLYGIEARLYRTQVSILTEYQAYFKCQKIFGESNVMRDKFLDNNGVDIRIDYNNQYYNLHIFSDTDRAWGYRNYKSKNKKANKLKGIHINLPYDITANNFTTNKLKNGVVIYTDEYVEYLKEKIDCGVIVPDEHNRSYFPKVSKCPNFNAHEDLEQDTLIVQNELLSYQGNQRSQLQINP